MRTTEDTVNGMKKVALALWVAMAAAGAQAEHGWGGYASYWEPSGWDGSFGGGVRMSIEALPNALVDACLSDWHRSSQNWLRQQRNSQ
jgi:hypothetical protein